MSDDLAARRNRAESGKVAPWHFTRQTVPPQISTSMWRRLSKSLATLSGPSTVAVDNEHVLLYGTCCSNFYSSGFIPDASSTKPSAETVLTPANQRLETYVHHVLGLLFVTRYYTMSLASGNSCTATRAVQ